MAYGVRGFVQIGIMLCIIFIILCAWISLWFIVILRSDIAEYVEQTELGVCQDDGDTSLFLSDEDNKPKCARKKGESCSIKGTPLPGDPMKLDCCAQPEFNKSSGRWEMDGAEAQSAQVEK